jgi:hypothetical protein
MTETTMKQTYGACVSTYVVFVVMFGTLVLMGVVAHDRAMMFWSSLPLALSLIWIRAFKISITKEAFEYRTLFSRKRIKLTDVEKVKLEVGYRNYSERFSPPVRLVIYPFSPSLKAIVVNVKVFGRGDLKAIFSFFGPKFIHN